MSEPTATSLAHSTHLGLIDAPWTVRPHPESHGRQHPYLWSCDRSDCESGGVGVNPIDAHHAAAVHHLNQHN